MSPGKPARDITIHVPRHNSQQIGPALTAGVESVAAEQGIKVDVRQPSFSSSDLVALAVERASEWNSLLITARAERGPQWDVATQQFVADEHSVLYYDPTPLWDSLKQEESKEEGATERAGDLQPPDFLANTASPHRGSRNLYDGGMQMSPGISHQGSPAPRSGGYTNSPFSAGQFNEGGSPLKVGYNPDNMNVTPDSRRRVTRGMVEEGYPGLR